MKILIFKKVVYTLTKITQHTFHWILYFLYNKIYRSHECSHNFNCFISCNWPCMSSSLLYCINCYCLQIAWFWLTTCWFKQLLIVLVPTPSLTFSNNVKLHLCEEVSADWIICFLIWAYVASLNELSHNFIFFFILFAYLYLYLIIKRMECGAKLPRLEFWLCYSLMFSTGNLLSLSLLQFSQL